MEFEKVVSERYATKKFDGKTVPQEKIDKLLELVRLAPSSFNIQPWKFYVVSDKALKAKLAPAAYNQPQIESSSHLIVMCANTEVEENIKMLESKMHASGSSKESIDPYISMMNGFFVNMTHAQKLAWAKNQVYIALGNALNGAKSLGLDSCPMEGFNAEEFSKILNLPKSHVPAVIVPVGYAADKPRAKLRFGQKEVVISA